MFDLEAKITEWRQQMLAAGINRPEVLDELESHLRERVGCLSLGLSKGEAFRLAAQELGDGKVLKSEFSKGSFLRRFRNNPIALNILGAWFILGGLNNVSQLIGLWCLNWPWDDSSIRYWTSAILALGSLQFVIGIGLLCRGKFWRYCALVFCGLSMISPVWDLANKFAVPGWDAPGHYMILMGIPVPMKFSASIDLLNLGMLLWGIYFLTKSSARNLFRPAAAR